MSLRDIQSSPTQGGLPAIDRITLTVAHTITALSFIISTRFCHAPADKHDAAFRPQPISPAAFRTQGARGQRNSAGKRRVKRRAKPEPPKTPSDLCPSVGEGGRGSYAQPSGGMTKAGAMKPSVSSSATVGSRSADGLSSGGYVIT